MWSETCVESLSQHFEDHEVTFSLYLQWESYTLNANTDWFTALFTRKMRIGSSHPETVARGQEALNFQGSISCLQIYTDALNPAHVHFASGCRKAADHKVTPCPPLFEYYDGMCYKVWLLKRNTLASGRIRRRELRYISTKDNRIDKGIEKWKVPHRLCIRIYDGCLLRGACSAA